MANCAIYFGYVIREDDAKLFKVDPRKDDKDDRDILSEIHETLHVPSTYEACYVDFEHDGKSYSSLPEGGESCYIVGIKLAHGSAHYSGFVPITDLPSKENLQDQLRQLVTFNPVLRELTPELLVYYSRN